jgi:hypothetical protein
LKIRLAYAVILLLLIATSNAAVLQGAPQEQRNDASLLKPSDSSYPAAMEFASFLNHQNINVRSVHRSKLESFFPNVTAAFFRTDLGSVEVIFFPEPDGAERVQIEEQRNDGRFSYSYSIRRDPDSGPRIVEATAPQYYIRQKKWLIVTSNKTISDALQPVS